MKPFRKWHNVFLVQNGASKKLWNAIPSVLDLIQQSCSNCMFPVSLFHCKQIQETLEKVTYFHFLIRLSRENVSQCMWTRLLLDTGPAGHQAECSMAPSHPPLRSPVQLSACFHFPASLSLPVAATSRAGALYAPRLFFFSNLCILITTSSISKGWMFWDNKIFPQVTLLFLPIDSCIKRKLLISRRKLSWFLYSLNLFSLKPLANLLFIFQGYKTKPNVIRQRSAHILNREQGLGSLVKSFIRATLKFLTK